MRLFTLIGLMLSVACREPTVLDAGEVLDAGPPDAGTPAADAGGDASVASDSGTAPDAAVDAGLVVVDAGVDLDLDGLDDAFENRIALEALPHLSLAPDDGCPTSAIIFQLHPHPLDSVLLHGVFMVLYNRDCGLASHAGDAETFGVTIDARGAVPQVKSMVAVSHKATVCEKKTDCGQCAGQTPCAMQNQKPVLFVSKNKHANYALASRCNNVLSCLDSCVLNPAPKPFALLNVGESGAPLVRNLTTAGLITPDAGFTEASVLNVDPFDAGSSFGTVDKLGERLASPDFISPACR